MTALNPGIKTTEFWITMLTYFISILNFTGVWDFISNWHQGVILMAATFGYKIARGLAKSGVVHAPNYVPVAEPPVAGRGR